MSGDAFIFDISFALGSRRQSLEVAQQNSQLVSSVDQLQRAGFGSHWIAGELQTAYDLAFESVKQMPSVSDCDLIVYATCLPQSASVKTAWDFNSNADVRHLMDFPASHLQVDFDIVDSAIVGLNQQGCTSALGAIRLARSLLLTEPGWSSALCLTSDRFPHGALYEQSYSLISDGAASFRMSANDGEFRVVACHHIANGGMALSDDDETAGAYFTYVHRLLTELGIEQLDWVVPQNMNVAAWRVMAGVLGIDHNRVWNPTLHEIGHVISSDALINLKSLQESGRLKARDRVALVMAGYGMHWQAVVLEAM